ncbi:hypothetical protein [Motilimonas pumila]|uniref:Uncharacterized protein n=1 Tax=Motilimonas pumila TaxID=2303987 RepID=A0A418YCF7_9GAMM|nr:hypothetical protein [Motilimonas pumila]RJG42209.1 hypothetical protein D1Z90_13980 [Motilimonas pumila]
MAYPKIDLPFKYRHTCWICAEPSLSWLALPQNPSKGLDCPHPPLSLPVCQECGSLANSAKVTAQDATELRQQLHQALRQKYRKHLDIGNNWTKQELELSEFEDKSFAGFKKSAWMMFEIARDRVEFAGWPLALDGVELAIMPDRHFEFDGIQYNNVASAISAHAKQFDVLEDYLVALVNKLGPSRFKAALQYARQYPTFDKTEIPQLLVGID